MQLARQASQPDKSDQRRLPHQAPRTTCDPHAVRAGQSDGLERCNSGFVDVWKLPERAVDGGEREGYRVIVVHGFALGPELVQVFVAELIAELTRGRTAQCRDEVDCGRPGVWFHEP
jgi:hypothetical protein